MQISTGSRAFDLLLGQGITGGLLVDVFGAAATGKSQLCFTLCSNCVMHGEEVFFVDTVGTFRPERMIEISGAHEVLNKITYFRAYSVHDQIAAVRKIKDLNPRLVVVDSATSLFSVEFSGAARHLQIMSYLHSLASAAITSGCSIIVTNMVRALLPPNEAANVSEGKSLASPEGSAFRSTREFLATSVSLYAHLRIELSIIDRQRSIYQARLVQPCEGLAQFSIVSSGLTDL